MNLLLNKLPVHVVVDGKRIPIETDFRYWIGLEIAFKNTDDNEKIKAISDIVKGNFPDNLDQLIECLSDFYLCGEKSDPDKGKSVNTGRLYDYEVDQYSIYSSFIQHYGIDLTTKELHWWIFKHMLLELPDDSTFKKIMLYRSIRIDSKIPKEQRNFYAEMKRLYALPDNKTKPQKARSYAQILAGGMTIK
jgi:hypothetical protein